MMPIITGMLRGLVSAVPGTLGSSGVMGGGKHFVHTVPSIVQSIVTVQVCIGGGWLV